MKTLSLSIILLCCVMAGCSGPVIPDDSQLQEAFAIRGGGIDVSADVQKAVFDRPIIVTTRCMPLVTGKGVIGLGGRNSNGEMDRHLLSPILDTVSVYQESYYTTFVPVEFKANQQFVQEWKVQLLQRTKPNGGSYFFDSYAYIDSIFIADSNRMYWIRSDVARKHCPSRAGWAPFAVSSTNIHLYP